ncbi:MAG TPA: histidine kinase N-terminal domain-containing protein [Microbacteriaceae bacterium]|nr:histidine kinase N-terminal domain-containing protein [Microbacteriaceae bacterium]
MATLSDVVLSRPERSQDDVYWLQLLVRDLPLLADLAFADLVLWVPNSDGQFVAVALARPSSAATLFYRDFVGTTVPDGWSDLVSAAYDSGDIVDSSALDWYEEIPTRVSAVPVRRRAEGSGELFGPIAVLTRHMNLGQTRTPSRQELASNEAVSELFGMISNGDFPDLGAPTGQRRGAPRASDGMIRLDVDGIVTFASPNAMSAFNRMGVAEELEGQSLAEVTTRVLEGAHVVDESLPLVVTGRAPWRTDIEARGVSVSLRAIPLRAGAARTGAVILCRDVTELRQQEQELLTKDATIREIHHRVKNNLQTVASLLRIQARRATTPEASDALGQAMRRVEAIALVHDTLSSGLSQNVDFDDVFDRVLMLAAEVASAHNSTAHTRKSGLFGVLPSSYATPLAVALTELVANAVEHGLKGQSGTVDVTAERGEEALAIRVHDSGLGLTDGVVGEGLGTQIVRTLIQGELSGTIAWSSAPGAGTDVDIRIPLRWMKLD